MIVALIALVASLVGTAYAAVGKNSVGSRQLKPKSVTAGKLANNSVTGAAVRNGSLSGADIDLNALGKVPSAQHADVADDSSTVGGHSAGCPDGTTLIRGICFDAAANAAVNGVTVAADKCATKGGYLPTPMELYSTRGVLNLGTGVGSDHQYTDTYYANTAGASYSTVVIDGTGAITEQSVTTPSKYTCAYPLVR